MADQKYEVRVVLNREITDEDFNDLSSLEGELGKVSLGVMSADKKRIIMNTKAEDELKAIRRVMGISAQLGARGYLITDEDYI